MSKLTTFVKSRYAHISAGVGTFFLAASANATSLIDASVLTTLQTNVIDTAKDAGAAGFSVQAVTVGLSIGIGLLGAFLHKGARS